MSALSRREFVRAGLIAGGSAVFGRVPWLSAHPHGRSGGAAFSRRYSCFYQVGRSAIDVYTDPEFGLPNDDQHAHVFAHSHASAYADRGLAEYIHAGGASFRYAPCFDLHEHLGWYTAPEEQLIEWGRAFRQAARAAGADYFGFNELPSTSGEDEQTQAQIMALLSALHEPEEDGFGLQGICFMTHRPSMPANWTSPASDFWERVNQTCALVVAEHYHGHGFVCLNTDAYLTTHFFAMWNWLYDSGEPAKMEVATDKFTVLHSSRYGPGQSGWQGANSDVVSLDEFQRNLARCAWITRSHGGGADRIAFAPIAAVYTDPAVHPMIRALINWHYNQADDEAELRCFDSLEDNCRCT